MTDDKQAVKTLAENLVKAMKSVSGASSQNITVKQTPTTISASKIVGLPAAISSIFSGIESAAAKGDAIAQQTLDALDHIAAGEFEAIAADTAMISKVYATFADFITLVAEDATIGDLDVETIRAGLADVGLINIGSASIDMAQIKRLSTQTAFIHESVQGKIYIDDLVVDDASIVNLAAGTVLINDNNGNLVELYVDPSTGSVLTRQVSYDGSEIINEDSLNGNTIIDDSLDGSAVIQNSLHGNKIISNSITTTQLNANEIFAYKATVMDLIADNIEASRLFAAQGFIPQLETTIISSSTIGEGLDLSSNSTITVLQDSIELLSSNISRTYIQHGEPFPVHNSDTWFNSYSEEHYVATGVIIPEMKFGVDYEGYLYNDYSDYYQFSMNSNGELMVLVTDEDVEDTIINNNIEFSVIEDHIYANGLWTKIENVAYSDLKINLNGVISEVYDSETGRSKIEQNADRIINIVTGDQSVPYVKTSSVEIKEDNIEIKSTGNVDIRASNFSISFNTNGTEIDKSRVDINSEIGIKVSDRFGGYFQANYNKIGLYDYYGSPKLYMDGTGNAVFSGKLEAATGTFAGELSAASGTFNGELIAATGTFAGTMSANSILGGTLIVGGDTNGSIIVKNGNNNTIGSWNKNGITINSGSINGGSINGASIVLGGSNNISGSLTVKNTTGTNAVILNSNGITVYKGNTPKFYVNSNGDVVFSGRLDAAEGTFNGTMSASKILGGTLTLGGTNAGVLNVLDSNNNQIGYWNSNGILIKSGTVNIGNNRFVVSNTGKVTAQEIEVSGVIRNVYTTEIDPGDGSIPFDEVHTTSIEDASIILDRGTGISGSIYIDWKRLVDPDASYVTHAVPGLVIEGTGSSTTSSVIYLPSRLAVLDGNKYKCGYTGTINGIKFINGICVNEN